MPPRLLRLVLALLVLALAPPALAAETGFNAFLQQLWPEAQKAGIERRVFDAAFAGLTPDPKVIALAKAQPEFNQTMWGYIDARVTPARIAEGKRLAAQWKPWLDRIEASTGVDRYVVLAIWALESNFGKAPGGADTIRSLATLACCTGKRPDYFRDELIAALKILEAHDIDPRGMTGSWAGALGQTQFMPTNFLLYAVDADGDGRRDIWRSVPDALASIANYLKLHDWDAGARWGYEVRLPAGFDFAAISRNEGAPMSAWAPLGLTRTDGGALPARGKAWLLLPAGAKGPAFLTFANYWAIKTYNISDSYTLSVGLLAERMRGEPGLAGRWPKGDTPLPRAAIEAMQKKLVSLGFPIEKVDGKVGPGTRTALRNWQASHGLTADGYATPAVLKALGVS